jgi:hypothetical protein
MAQFLRHIGKVGDRKVAVIFRQVPGETHMALVVYSQLLNQNIHDPLMAAIESATGQQAKDLADALNRAYTKDGKIILHVLHTEGMMKKIQTNQVVMTPAPNQTIRLNELNDLLDEMEKGEAAVRRMAEIDASRGLQDPADVARRMRGESTIDPVTAGVDTLGNDILAQNLMGQAARMAAEAKGLLAESERLQKEAQALLPQINISATPTEQPAKKKPGRQKKAPPAAG